MTSIPTIPLITDRATIGDLVALYPYHYDFARYANVPADCVSFFFDSIARLTLDEAANVVDLPAILYDNLLQRDTNTRNALATFLLVSNYFAQFDREDVEGWTRHVTRSAGTAFRHIARELDSFAGLCDRIDFED